MRRHLISLLGLALLASPVVASAQAGTENPPAANKAEKGTKTEAGATGNEAGTKTPKKSKKSKKGTASKKGTEGRSAKSKKSKKGTKANTGATTTTPAPAK